MTFLTPKKEFTEKQLLESHIALAHWLDFPPSIVGFVCLFGFLTSSSTAKLYRRQAPRQSVWQFNVLPHMGDHDFCISRSHYTDTDPTSRERAATAGIKLGTSSPGVARSTDWANAAPSPIVENSFHTWAWWVSLCQGPHGPRAKLPPGNNTIQSQMRFYKSALM